MDSKSKSNGNASDVKNMAKQRRYEKQKDMLKSTVCNVSALPRILNVIEYTQSRMNEIQEFSRTLRGDAGTSLRRVYQNVPRHLRRRAMSHNPHRLPKHLRYAATKEMQKMQVQQKGQTTVEHKSRVSRRAPRSLLLDHLMRSLKNQWLETHTWAAKRSHMMNAWGYRVGRKLMDKAERACIRMGQYLSIVHDASYIEVIELDSEKKDITMVFAFLDIFQENIVIPVNNADPSLAQRVQMQVCPYKQTDVVAGKKEVDLKLYYPSVHTVKKLTTQYKNIDTSLLPEETAEMLLACGKVMIQGTKVWISVHASCAAQVTYILQSLSPVFHVSVSRLQQQLGRLRIRGPRSHAVLQSVLRVHEDSKVWGLLQSLRVTSSLPAGVVVPLKVTNPYAVICRQPFLSEKRKRKWTDLVAQNKDKLQKLSNLPTSVFSRLIIDTKDTSVPATSLGFKAVKTRTSNFVSSSLVPVFSTSSEEVSEQVLSLTRVDWASTNSPLFDSTLRQKLSLHSPLRINTANFVRKHFGKQELATPLEDGVCENNSVDSLFQYKETITQEDKLGFWHSRTMPNFTVTDDTGVKNAIVTERSRVAASRGSTVPQAIKGTLVTHIMLVQASNGWDVILPYGWTKAFYTSLVHAGARHTAVQEYTAYAAEHNEETSLFPSVHVDSLAGMVYQEHLRRQKVLQVHRATKYPVNFWKLARDYPYGSELATIMGKTNTNATIVESLLSGNQQDQAVQTTKKPLQSASAALAVARRVKTMLTHANATLRKKLVQERKQYRKKMHHAVLSHSAIASIEDQIMEDGVDSVIRGKSTRSKQAVLSSITTKMEQQVGGSVPQKLGIPVAAITTHPGSRVTTQQVLIFAASVLGLQQGMFLHPTFLARAKAVLQSVQSPASQVYIPNTVDQAKRAHDYQLSLPQTPLPRESKSIDHTELPAYDHEVPCFTPAITSAITNTSMQNKMQSLLPSLLPAWTTVKTRGSFAVMYKCVETTSRVYMKGVPSNLASLLSSGYAALAVLAHAIRLEKKSPSLLHGSIRMCSGGVPEPGSVLALPLCADFDEEHMLHSTLTEPKRVIPVDQYYAQVAHSDKVLLPATLRQAVGFVTSGGYSLIDGQGNAFSAHISSLAFAEAVERYLLRSSQPSSTYLLYNTLSMNTNSKEEPTIATSVNTLMNMTIEDVYTQVNNLTSPCAVPAIKPVPLYVKTKDIYHPALFYPK